MQNSVAYFEFVRKYACWTNPLPDLAYVNVFVQKSQPFEYPGYVPGCLPAKDGYAHTADHGGYTMYTYVLAIL